MFSLWLLQWSLLTTTSKTWRYYDTIRLILNNVTDYSTPGLKVTRIAINLKEMYLDHALVDPLWVSVLQFGLFWVHVPPKHSFIFINFRHGPAVRLRQQSERERDFLKQLVAWQEPSSAATVNATKTGSQHFGLWPSLLYYQRHIECFGKIRHTEHADNVMACVEMLLKHAIIKMYNLEHSHFNYKSILCKKKILWNQAIIWVNTKMNVSIKTKNVK